MQALGWSHTGQTAFVATTHASRAQCRPMAALATDRSTSTTAKQAANRVRLGNSDLLVSGKHATASKLYSRREGREGWSVG